MAIRKIVSRSIGTDVIAAEDLANNSVTVAEITDGAVTSAKMNGLTGSSSGIIQADGDGSLSTTTADLINDTTPQLGGDLDLNSNNINDGTLLIDSSRIRVPNASANPSSPNDGDVFYDTDEEQLKVYANGVWMPITGRPNDSDTFDILGDGSALAFYKFEDDVTDEGHASFDGTRNGNPPFTTTHKFGTKSLNLLGDGKYVDFTGIPSTLEAVSFWWYKSGSDNGYLIDFRHDDASNGRGYVYSGASNQLSLTTDTTAVGSVGRIWVDSVEITSSSPTGPVFSDGNWYHVVISKDGRNDPRQNWDQGIRLGNRSDGTTEGDFGYVDQMRLFTRPLGQNDVDILYNETETS